MTRTESRERAGAPGAERRPAPPCRAAAPAHPRPGRALPPRGALLKLASPILRYHLEPNDYPAPHGPAGVTALCPARGVAPYAGAARPRPVSITARGRRQRRAR
jgi:hypothetical protein